MVTVIVLAACAAAIAGYIIAGLGTASHVQKLGKLDDEDGMQRAAIILLWPVCLGLLIVRGFFGFLFALAK